MEELHTDSINGGHEANYGLGHVPERGRTPIIMLKLGATLACSHNGWFNDVIAFEYLKHFHKHAKPIGVYRLLVLNGYGSYIMFEFKALANEYKIILLYLLWRNGLNHHIKRNEQWHDDMHMYGIQLPRRLLSKGTTQEHTHTNTYHLLHSIHTYMPAEGRWEAPFYRPVIRRCSGAALVPP
jgi:hypothetical protein